MIIAFEGGEGSGKVTQICLLEKALTDLGFDILSIIEPGGTPTGQAIRNVLLERKDLKILGATEMFLFSASRAQQVREVVRPALAKGKIILSDRSKHSTEAYQGYARGESLEMIETLTQIAIGNTRPDYVILLDIPPEEGIKRKHKQNEFDKLDAEKLSFHKKAREGYLKMAKDNSENWFVVDATLPPEKIHKIVLDYVLKILQKEKDNADS